MKNKSGAWVIKGQLAGGPRPGYDGRVMAQVVRADVDDWIAAVKANGIQSIICLLDDDHLRLYENLPGGLLAYYRASGFEVAHVPARDHQLPALTADKQEMIWNEYQRLRKPVLVHCSAGQGRTRLAVAGILKKLGKSATGC